MLQLWYHGVNVGEVSIRIIGWLVVKLLIGLGQSLRDAFGSGPSLSSLEI